MRSAREGSPVAASGHVVGRLPDVVAVAVTLLMTWPMWFAGGYGLTRDMVFTPRYPWGAEALGAGDRLPRAVPLDGLLAALGTVLDGSVSFRVLVPFTVVAIAAGAHRMVRGLPVAARCLAAVIAVWNPYVVERLALGQWALLLGLAALIWLVMLLPELPRAGRAAWPAVGFWCLAGSLTPSGGLLVLASVVVLGLAAGWDSRASRVALIAGCAQLPWLVAGLWNAAGSVGGTVGVEAFAARAERPGGLPLTLLTGGGSWASATVPPTLTGWLGQVLTAIVVVVLATSARALWRTRRGLVILAAGGFVLAALAWLPGGRGLLEWTVTTVPGGGLLRDGHKWLAPYVVLMIVASAHAMTTLGSWVRRVEDGLVPLVSMVMLTVPLALMIDAPGLVQATLRPVEYPESLRAVVARLDAESAGTGAVITLPWASYRRFEWGNPVSVADPLPRWTRHPWIGDDALLTEQGEIDDESGRARRVAAVAGQQPVDVAALARLGVGWALVYRDQPGAEELSLPGGPLIADDHVALYRIDGPLGPPAPGPEGLKPAILTALNLAYLLGLASAGVLGLVMLLARSGIRRPSQVPVQVPVRDPARDPARDSAPGSTSGSTRDGPASNAPNRH